jgi:hypothetical protein
LICFRWRTSVQSMKYFFYLFQMENVCSVNEVFFYLFQM